MYAFITRLSIVWFIMPCSVGVVAQMVYQIDQHVPVEEGGVQLNMPWAGGLNSAQINTMDLNEDGQQDLVVFDRYANKPFTFLSNDKRYIYSPEYELLLPAGLRHWVLLRDFNCDGKKDIFTSDSFGVIAFVNTTREGHLPSWRPFNAGRPLLAQGVSTIVNIKINSSDIPAIDDIDNDGDLDMLNFKFVGPSTIQWHKNLSMEKGNGCDSLQFERVLTPPDWGNVEECGCGQFALPETGCTQRIGGITHHAGGKALLTLDVDNDGDKDLITSEEGCPNLFMLTNGGTSQSALITASTSFPISKPVVTVTFPAAFFEDVDFDGRPDLIASPNVYSRGRAGPFSLQQSIWLYKNTRSTQHPEFTFVRDNFLQGQMIDVGDAASPAFTDYDGDGDQDMFIGNYGNANLAGTLFQYENTGTASEPSFQLVTDDFAGLSQIGFLMVKPQFTDINMDGNIDLVFTAFGVPDSTPSAPRQFSVFYALGTSKDRLDIDGQHIKSTAFPLNYNEKVCIVDVDLDGAMDILVSRASGALEYWKNEGVSDTLSYYLHDSSFLGLGSSPIAARHITITDLDADGKEDMLLGDRSGYITIYEDFRNLTDAADKATRKIVYDAFIQAPIEKSFGGQISPVAVNLFNAGFPALVVGTVTGGVHLLRPLKEEKDNVAVQIYPNPVRSDKTLSVLSTRDAAMQIFTIGGQKILAKPVPIAANQVSSFDLTPIGLAAGIYIARFNVGRQTYSRYFLIIH